MTLFSHKYSNFGFANFTLQVSLVGIQFAIIKCNK